MVDDRRIGPNPEHRTPDTDARSSAFRSGFVAVVGRPNVGKSTLVNRLVGQKVAITAAVPQTTRALARGVVTLPHAQIVLVDTPGIHRPRHQLGNRMVEVARRALLDADVVLFLVDATEGVTAEDEAVAALLRTVSAPAVVGLTKIDGVDAGRLATVEAAVNSLGRFSAVVAFSAVTGANLGRLVEDLVSLLHEGPAYYPPEMVTDQPEQYLVRELIREQAIHLTREEVPYSIAVEIEEMAPREGRDLTYIRAIVHVERDAHKKMLIGRDGRMLKEIGRRARLEIEGLLRHRVYLDLWVKVSRRWRERGNLISQFYPE